MNKMPLYLDSASTTPVDPRVIEAMLPYFSEIFGNASSNHIYGKQAKNAIEVAREQVARLINADNKEIIFTSGATESINLAIKGFVEANVAKGNHIITVKTEHKAVLSTCEYLETKGFEVTYLDVNENGLVTEVAEKNPISDNATVGYYFWKYGSDFVKYAEQMIEKNIRVNNEFYVCPVFNQAIDDGKEIRTFNTEKMWGLGTPEDLKYYLENKK